MEGPGAGLLRCCERVDRFDGDDMVLCWGVLCVGGCFGCVSVFRWLYRQQWVGLGVGVVLCCVEVLCGGVALTTGRIQGGILQRKWEERRGEMKKGARERSRLLQPLYASAGARALPIKAPAGHTWTVHAPSAAAADVGQFKLKPHHSDSQLHPTTPQLGAAQHWALNTARHTNTTTPGRIAPEFAPALPATLSTIFTISTISTS